MKIGDLVKLSAQFYGHNDFYGVIVEVHKTEAMRAEQARYKVQWLGLVEKGQTQAIWYLGSYLEIIQKST